MNIGINAVAAFKEPRTGVEEYVYQLIKHLTMLKDSDKHHFILYSQNNNNFNFKLPNNFEINKLRWSLPMWTQIRLTAEILKNKPDILFIPVHVLPFIHPENSVTTIHGLEYEYYPEMYPANHLRYLRWSTKYALKNTKKIITVSQNTKNDLIKLYNADPDKIKVIYHGFNDRIRLNKLKPKKDYPYILFLGRLETKKNVQGLIKAFNSLKKKYQVPHKLILAGSNGFGHKDIRSQISKIKFKDDIIDKGYVSEKDKMVLLRNAEMFVLPSFYEGFGMPILEAQAAKCPVITSNVSSMPEVAGEGAILIDPENIEQISNMMYKIIDDNDFRKRLIKEGSSNLERFSWQECAQETLKFLLE